MIPETWLSILLGLGVGGLYGLAFLFTSMLANRFNDNRFLLIVFGGMLSRMAILLVAVSVVVLFIPIKIFVFVVALVATVIISMSLEVWIMYRRMKSVPKSEQQAQM